MRRRAGPSAKASCLSEVSATAFACKLIGKSCLRLMSRPTHEALGVVCRFLRHMRSVLCV